MQAHCTNDNGTTYFAATSSNDTGITMHRKRKVHDDVANEIEQKKIRLDTVIKETKPIIVNLEYFPINSELYNAVIMKFIVHYSIVLAHYIY